MVDGAALRRTVTDLLRPDLRGLVEYEPIEPVEVLAERLGVPVERIVKLDGNENLYGPSPRVRRALAEHDGYHIYPDPDQRRVWGGVAGGKGGGGGAKPRAGGSGGGDIPNRAGAGAG